MLRTRGLMLLSRSSLLLEREIRRGTSGLDTTTFKAIRKGSTTERSFSSHASEVLGVPKKQEDEQDEVSKSSWSGDSLWRLAELSRREWKLVAMSAATLGITSSVTLILPYASGQVIDFSVDGSGELSPAVMAGGLFGLTALAGGGVYLRSLWLAKAGNRIVARLKQRLYGSLLQQESSFLDQQTTGDLLSRLTADAQLVQAAVTTQAVSGLRGVVMSIGSATMLLYTSPTLAAVSVCTLPPIFILSQQVGRRLKKHQEEVQELQGAAASLAEQSLSNISTVKHFVGESYETNNYRTAIAKAHGKAVETAHMQAQLEGVSHVAANAAVLCVLGYGGNMVWEGIITAGDLAGFVMYSLLMAGNLSALSSLYGDLMRAVAASNRVFDILERTPSIPPSEINKGAVANLNEQDPLVPVEWTQPAAVAEGATSATNDTRGPLGIEIHNLSFRYPTRSDVEVLKDFDLTVAPGEVLALVGGSGSGKSTIASLLTRLYDVEGDGQILIDGRSIKDFDIADLRSMIGVVSQEPALFRGSIRDNIAYGEWDRATEKQIMEAAQLARVVDFAQDFPDGMGTLVGPRGTQLSGGQKQRVALARVLIKNPPLVILDEATSALDANSEYHVQKAMDSVLQTGGRTVLSIAHRLSTIRHASRIAVLENGNVVQTGTFEEVSSVDGPFRDLMKTQLVTKV